MFLIIRIMINYLNKHLAQLFMQIRENVENMTYRFTALKETNVTV